MTKNDLLLILFILFLSLAFLLGCGVQAQPQVSSSELSFEKDMIPIFTKSCNMCHNESTPGRNWKKYEEVYAKRALVKHRVVVTRTMPIGVAISEKDRALIGEWVDQGARK